MSHRKYLKTSGLLLMLSAVFVGYHPAWSGKTEYNIEYQGQIFNDPQFNRKTLHISRYTPDNLTEKAPSIVFFHGGPGLKNEGQFDEFISQFTNQGYQLYVPEIIGSSYYDTCGMDANEYKKTYTTDIKAVLTHIKEQSSEKIYAIAHSLGCHQLFRFMVDPENHSSFEAISAIAGPWDIGANRLFGMIKDWRNTYQDHQMKTLAVNTARSHVGFYIKREEEEKPITIEYNPTVSPALNKQFSVIYQTEQLPRTLPLQFMHAIDDPQVCSSLSFDMIRALRDENPNVSGYFISTGGHGFIKNPLDSNALDEIMTKKLRNAAEGILQFFKNPTRQFIFDDQSVSFEDIFIPHDARKDHEEFLKKYFLPVISPSSD